MSDFCKTTADTFCRLYDRAANIKYKRTVYFIAYTAMFAVAMVCVYLSYVQNGKFIAGGNDSADALTQQLTFFRYWGEYIRDFFSSVAEGHPELPLWTWSVTGGADILGTFAHYDITNPIMLLAGFFDGNTAEQGWAFLILLRTYLAGAAFSAFCLYHKKSRSAILAGSLVYITSFYVSVLCAEQEMYFNMAIYLPLMLLAIDKGMRERTYGLLIATVFLAIISSYYFFYMITILSAVYAVFRYWHNAPRIRKAPQTFLFLARLVLPFLAGIALSAVVFLPQLHAFLNNARTVTPELSIFYNSEFYWRYIMRFVAQGARCDSQAPGIGAGAMALLAVIYLFSKRRRYGQEKFFIVLLTVFSLFPLFGWTMNGFSYATNNRWHLGFVLTLSWVVVQTLPDLLQETKIQKGIIGFAGFYTIVTCCFYIPFLEDRRNLLVCAMLLMGSMLFGFTIPWRNYFALQRSKNHSGRGRKAVAGALSIVFIFVCVAAVNSDEKDIGKQNTLRYSFNAGETQSLLTDDSALDMVKNDNSFFRVTRPTTQIVERNRELLFGLGSPLGYWSITNKYISQFRRALGTEKFRQFVVQSNDSATYVEALLCTKYLLPTASVPTIPYGYRKILTKGNDGNNYEVYQNEYFLPLGTTYNTYVTEKDFYTLSYEQRQQVMLQSLLVDDQKAARKLKLKKSHSSQSAAAVAYTAETDNHIIWDEGNKTITVKRPGTIVLYFQNFPNSEIHLNLENFQFIRHFSNTEVLEMTNPAPTQAERANAKQADKKLGRLNEVQYTVTIGEVSKTERQAMPYANEYTGNYDHVTNLGVFKNSAERTITLTFNAPGVYTYDRLDVVCQPLDTYAAEIAARTEDVLENVIMDTNSITGTISLDQKKALYLSIPYSEGWSAKVDGKKAELFHANIMGMALSLEKGDHTIQLCYRSPWLKEGAVISGATALALLLFLLSKKILKNTRRRRGNSRS